MSKQNKGILDLKGTPYPLGITIWKLEPRKNERIQRLKSRWWIFPDAAVRWAEENGYEVRANIEIKFMQEENEVGQPITDTKISADRTKMLNILKETPQIFLTPSPNKPEIYVYVDDTTHRWFNSLQIPYKLVTLYNT